MASFQNVIVLTVLQSKDFAGCMGEKFLNREKYGETVDKCDYMKLMLLIRWIKIMESYYCNNYTADGNIGEPNMECLTLAEAQELIAKMKSFIGV